MLKFLNGNTYEAGKTKKGKLVVAGNVGGVPNPQPTLIYGTINAGSTALGKKINKTGEDVASTVAKRRDVERIFKNIVNNTQAARFRLAGK